VQPIPAAIATLLSSRSMTGADAPAAQVELLGMTEGPLWTSPSAFRRPAANSGIYVFADTAWIGEISVARKTNGKLIVVSCYSTSADSAATDVPVMEGEVANVAALLAGDDSVTGWTATGISLRKYARCCVFNVGDDLYLDVAHGGDFSGGAPAAGCWIYKSPSGNGGDWTLHGTVYSATMSGTEVGNFCRKTTAGQPLITSTGRWVLVIGRYALWSGYMYPYQTVYTSDDAGVTWTQRTTLNLGGIGTGMDFKAPVTRNLVETADGSLWASMSVDWGSFYLYAWRSTDGGETWSVAWSVAGSAADYFASPTLYARSDGLGFYLFGANYGGTGVRLMQFPYPASGSDYEVIATWEHGHANFYRPLAVDLVDDGYTVLAVGNEVIGWPLASATITVDSVQVNREQAAMSQRAQFSRPNVNPADPTDTGHYSPDRGDDDPELLNQWADQLLPGKQVVIKLGYGQELATVFTGAIDDVTLEANGAAAHVTVECRDNAWQIIDKVVTNDSGGYKLSYSDAAVEAIVADLLERAGIDVGDITTETTGIAVAEKAFERISYADALSWCQTVSGFELLCDELGQWSFHYPTDRQPEAQDEALVLDGVNWTELEHDWVVTSSERVRSAVSGGGTLYVKDTDYEIEYGSPARIRRKVGGGITDGGTVYLTYVHAAWSFTEGVDLLRLPYRISRRDLYGKIVVLGQDAAGGLISASYTYSGSTDYGVPADKVLFVEMRELDTEAKCQACADQLGTDMVKKLREVSFAAVGNPWIQVGDCVRVRESSSTASEIYRVTSLDHRVDAGGFLSQFTAYHYGYTPL